MCVILFVIRYKVPFTDPALLHIMALPSVHIVSAFIKKENCSPNNPGYPNRTSNQHQHQHYPNRSLHHRTALEISMRLLTKKSPPEIILYHLRCIVTDEIQSQSVEMVQGFSLNCSKTLNGSDSEDQSTYSNFLLRISVFTSTNSRGIRQLAIVVDQLGSYSSCHHFLGASAISMILLNMPSVSSVCSGMR